MKKSAKQSKRSSKRGKKKPDPLSHIPTNLRKIIATSADRYLGVLGMNHYVIKIFYSKKNATDEEFVEIHNNKGSVLASITVDTRYLNANVYIYPPLVNKWKSGDMDDRDVEEAIAHEISHIATQHMYQMATSVYKDDGEMRDAWESLTTIVGRLIHENGFHREKKNNKKK